MKNIKILRGLLAGAVCVFAISCSGDDDDISSGDGNGAAIDVQELTQISETGTWRITNFVDDGEDETANFSNFTFTFNPDGTVTAVDGDNSITGTWDVVEDSDDDDNSSDADFVLAFNVDDDSDFDDLNDDWDVESHTNDRINLGDDDDDDNDDDDDDDDTLIFEKN